MRIDLGRLIGGFVEELEFEGDVIIDDELIKKTDIRRLEGVRVKGYVRKSLEDYISLFMNISGVMVLPCGVTLVDVEYPFNIETDEILSENSTENEEYIKISDNSIEIIPIIWQNIVMEIPLKVVSPTLDRRNIGGIGWKLISEDELEDKLGGDIDGSSI